MKNILILVIINLLVMNEVLAQNIPKRTEEKFDTEAPFKSGPQIKPVPKKDETKKDEIVNIADERTRFVGGMVAYDKFLKDNIKYPVFAKKTRQEGTVYLYFVVDKDGSIIKDCVRVAKSVSLELDAEAMRVFKMSPKWVPAINNKLPVRQRISMPVRFRLDK